MTAPEVAYAELATASHFSFLRGASKPKHLVLASILRGHAGLGLADRNTLAGVVRAWSALNEIREHGLSPVDRMRVGGSPGEIAIVEDPLNDPAQSEAIKARAKAFRLVVGTRLVFNDGSPDIVAYPENRIGWARLTRLLTLGNRRAIKGQCEIGLSDLLADPHGLLLIVMPPDRLCGFERVLAQIAEGAPGAVWLAATMLRRGDDQRRLVRLQVLAAHADITLIATNDVLYHSAEERDLQDVMTCKARERLVSAHNGLANAAPWLVGRDVVLTGPLTGKPTAAVEPMAAVEKTARLRAVG